MNDSNNRYLMVLSLLLLVAWGCGSNDSESNAGQMADGAVSPDQGVAMTDASNGRSIHWSSRPMLTASSMKRRREKGPGKQIENFISEQYNGSVDSDGQSRRPLSLSVFRWWRLRGRLGIFDDRWCGACESYVERDQLSSGASGSGLIIRLSAKMVNTTHRHVTI